MEIAESKKSNSGSLFLQQIMFDMRNGVMALDKKGRVIYSNPQMESFFEKDTLVGETVHSLMYEHDNPQNDAFWDVLMEVIQGRAIHFQKRVPYVAPSGRRYSFHIVSSYLSGEEEGVVITISDETEYDLLVQKKHDTTLLLIGTLLIVCLTALVTELHVFLSGSFPHAWIARSTEIATVVFLVILLKYTSLSWKDFGIFPKNLSKELFESISVVVVMVFGMAVAKMIMIRNGSTMFQTDRPFFDFTAPPDFYYIKYIGIVFLQEVQTKCGLQESITRVLDNKHANLLAIVVISIVFMALHVQHGLVYMVGAGVLSAVLAVLYSRHNSLLGCGLVHYAFGIFGLVLGWIV